MNGKTNEGLLLKEITEEHYKLIEDLRSHIRLGKKLLIGIDGDSGAGKSSLAKFLSWQFSIYPINLDFFLQKQEGQEGNYYYSGLNFAEINKQIDQGHYVDGPVIIEGIFLLETLKRLGIKHDILIYVVGLKKSGMKGLEEYENEYDPLKKADYTFKLQKNAG